MSSWPSLFAAALAIWLLLKGPAAKTPLFVQKACRIAIVFFAILRVPVSLEMGPILEMDAVIGIREPKQGRRLSDPDIDARLAHCDTANPVSRFPIPRSRCWFR